MKCIDCDERESTDTGRCGECQDYHAMRHESLMAEIAEKMMSDDKAQASIEAYRRAQDEPHDPIAE